MRSTQVLIAQLLLACSPLVSAASWSFEDGSVSISIKGAGIGGAQKETYAVMEFANGNQYTDAPNSITPGTALSKPLTLSTAAALRVSLTATNGGKGRRAHQAFLTLASPSSGLEESYPLVLKESGKGKVDVPFNNIPLTFLTSKEPVDAYIVIGSFGSSTPYKSKAFSLQPKPDANIPLPKQEEQLRYGKQPEIHHVFRADPKSPPKVITLVFTAAVLACLPILLGTWLTLGANLSHFSKALGAAPVSHALFFGSVLAIEGVFFLYYTSWNLFQTLPVACAIGLVAFLSGSKALTEVQERRLAGLR